MKLAIDIDNCLSQTQVQLCKIIKSKFGIEATTDLIMDYDWVKCFSITEGQVSEVLDEFHCNCYDVQPIAGGPEAIRKLKRQHEIHIVTARDSKYAVEATQKWLIRHAIPYDSLTFASDKLPVCSELNIDFIVEDKGETARQFAENGIKTILIDYPWNREFSHENIFRVYDWSQVLAVLEADGA